jgi:hypothetical protein
MKRHYFFGCILAADSLAMSPELIGVLRASVPSPKCLESRRGQLAVFPRCPLDPYDTDMGTSLAP